MPDINPQKVCYIVIKARQFDVKEDVVEEDYGSNPADDAHAILAAYGDDPVFQELKQVIDDLNIDEQCELVALAWIGRGDFGADEWADAMREARDRHTKHTAEYLLGMPMLADYLEEGLAAFDITCEDFEKEHL